MTGAKVIKTQYNKIPFQVVVSNQTLADESHNNALWCKGSTQEFDSCNTGSIPVRVAMGKWRSGSALVAHWSYKPVVIGSIPFFPIRRKPWNILTKNK